MFSNTKVTSTRISAMKLGIALSRGFKTHAQETKNLLFLGLWILSGIIFVRLVVNVEDYIFYERHAIDSAGFVSLLSNLATTGEMKSSIFSSFYSLLPTLTMSFEEFTSYNFASQYSEESFFRWHAYIISYILSFFVYVGVPAFTISILTNIVGTFGVIFIVIGYCYRNNISFPITLGITLAFLYFLPIKEVVYGQFYFDKLFPFFMLWLCVNTQDMLDDYGLKKSKTLALIILTIVCATISERAALMSGTFLIFFGLLYQSNNSTWKKRIILVMAGLGCIVWFLIYNILFYDSLYASSTSPANIIYNAKRLILDDVFQDKAFVLFQVLIPHIIFGLLSPLAGFIAVFAVIPNFLIDIGGAEKIGFSTHYHMMYLPFIVFANLGAVKNVCNSFSRSKYLLDSQTLKKLAHLSCVVVVFSIFMVNSTVQIDYVNRSIKYEFQNRSYIYPYLSSFQSSNKPKVVMQIEHAVDDYDGLMISASNSLMTLLPDLGAKVIDAFPISIFDADIIIVERSLVGAKEGVFMLPNLASYVPENLIDKRKWLSKQLLKNFDPVLSVQIRFGRDIVLYKKNHLNGDVGSSY